MTSKSETKLGKLIHVAQIFKNGSWKTLLLRKEEGNHFAWYEEMTPEQEAKTEVSAGTIEEAIRLASREWRTLSFKTLNCGFRYTLPERDEHGINALFAQMAASYGTSSGIYYDEELGNNCFVQNASEEALQLWQRLISLNRFLA